MTVRINVQRLLRGLVTSLIAPLLLAILFDWQLGWFPLITIGATVIFIPLSTVVVVRAALAELDQIIQQVAPIVVEAPIEATVTVFENDLNQPGETFVSAILVGEIVDTKINSNVL